MPTVHLFACTGRFHSVQEVRAAVDPTYKTDTSGEVERVPSRFVTEIELDDFEPMCIEAIHSEGPKPLMQLLEGVSYGEQWVGQVPAELQADAAICVFAPNVVENPQASSIPYIGSYEYEE